jgi:hypothetical protein
MALNDKSLIWISRARHAASGKTICKTWSSDVGGKNVERRKSTGGATKERN